MTRVSVLGIFLSLALCSSLVFASGYEEAPTSNIPLFELSPLVISATQYPVSVDKTGKDVQVLTKKELNSFPFPTLHDALNLFSGLSVSDAGGTTALQLRGLPTDLTKILYDGISLKDPISTQGTPILDTFILSQLDQIEMVEGSESSLYGSQAIGGVIQLIPKYKGSTFDLTLGQNKYFTSLDYHTSVADTHFDLGVGKSYDASLSSRAVGSEKDAIEKENYNLHLQKQFGPLDASVFYRRNQVSAQLDEQFDTPQDDPNSYILYNQDLTGMKLDASFIEHLHSIFTLNYNYLNRHSVNDVDATHTTTSNASYTGSTLFADLRHTLRPMNEVAFTIGTDLSQETGTSLYASTYSPPSVITSNTLTTYGLYGHAEYNAFIPFQYGARYEYSYGTKSYTYSLSSYKYIHEIDLTFKGNFGTGFRAPTLYERFSNPAYASHELLPENSLAKDLSIEKKIGNFCMSATWFETQVTNKINYHDLIYPIPGYYENISGITQTNGLTFSMRQQKWGVLDLFKLDYTLNSSNELRVPGRKFSVYGLFTHDLYSWGTSIVYVSPRSDYGSTQLEEYTLVNIKLSYQFTPQLNGSISIQNLLNSNYQEAAGFSTPGRNVLIGASYQFE